MSLEDHFRHIEDDPEERRAEEDRRQRLLEEVRSVASRPLSGPDSPTDKELLGLVSELFHEVYATTPFEEDYDPLIERLSFTARKLDGSEAAELKTAWPRFLDESGVDFGWPVNVGMAEWYVDHEMVGPAIAVYEHLYSEIRGRLRDECSELIEGWLMSLLYLCRDKGLYSRARHLCEAIEDYHNDGVVSDDSFIEIALIRPDLKYRELGGTFQEDRRLVRERLAMEHCELLDRLHPTTKTLVVDAELWSDDHWRSLEPGIAPLYWSKAVESEFHRKVYQPKRPQLESVLGARAPRHGQTCGLGHMIELIGSASSNPSVGCLLAQLRNPVLVRSATSVLRTIKQHRDDVAHVRAERVYSIAQCEEFLRVVRDCGWVFKFLESIQPSSR